MAPDPDPVASSEAVGTGDQQIADRHLVLADIKLTAHAAGRPVVANLVKLQLGSEGFHVDLVAARKDILILSLHVRHVGAGIEIRIAAQIHRGHQSQIGRVGIVDDVELIARIAT